MTFVTWGGLYGNSIRDFFVRPFQNESGTVVNQGVNSGIAPVKSQVLSGNVQWDLVDLAGGDFIPGTRENLFEPIDYGSLDTTNVPEYAKHEYGIEYAFFLGGMGYDMRRIPPSSAPDSWATFWNTSHYPGVRALSTHITDAPTLEGALLAAGVPMADLYPLDVPAAFDSLRALGKENIFWYGENQESVNFLEQQQGPLCSTFNGLVEISSRDGAKSGFVYNDVQLTGDYLAIPRGAKNKDAAYALLNYILNNAEQGAQWMTHTYYTVANTKAAELVSPDVADKLATSPNLQGKIFTKDNDWWSANGDRVVREFQRFISL